MDSKNLYGKIAFILLYIGLTSIMYAHEFDLPSSNPDVISTFYSNTLSILSLMDNVKSFGFDRVYYDDDFDEFRNSHYHNSILFFFDGYGKFAINNAAIHGKWQYNGSIGSMIRINDYFSIPLFFSAVGAEIEDNSVLYSTTSGITSNASIFSDPDTFIYHSLYTGGGLIFSCKYGTVGALAGYYNFWGDASLQMNKTENAVRWQDHIKYGVIPVLDTTQYPILKYVLKGIQSYLSFDFAKDKLAISGYITRIISRPFIIIKNISFFYTTDYIFAIDSIYYSYTDQLLSAAAKTQRHTGGITLGFFDGWFSLEFEAGFEKITELSPGMLRYAGGGVEIDKYNFYYSTFIGLKKRGVGVCGFVFNMSPVNHSYGFIFKTSFSGVSIGIGPVLDASVRYRIFQDK